MAKGNCRNPSKRIKILSRMVKIRFVLLHCHIGVTFRNYIIVYALIVFPQNTVSLKFSGPVFAVHSGLFS